MQPQFRIAPLPRPARPGVERRKQRSACPATALEYALDSAQRRGELDLVLLVDDHGTVVSHSRTSIDLSMLAAVTPIIGRGKAVPRIRRNGESREMTVRSLEVEGELLYMAAIGGDMFRRLREVRASIAATQRILA